jgi:hypothetical protein
MAIEEIERLVRKEQFEVCDEIYRSDKLEY